MLKFLIRENYFQSISYPIVLTKLDGPIPDLIHIFKLWKRRESNPQPHDK